MTVGAVCFRFLVELRKCAAFMFCVDAVSKNAVCCAGRCKSLVVGEQKTKNAESPRLLGCM